MKPIIKDVSFKKTLHTNGSGLWSNVKKAIKIKKLRLGYLAEDLEFGELRVYFDSSWNVSKDGLIYTDKLFLKELRQVLDKAGYVGKDVSYNEQGMQGVTYVSCDVGGKFLKSFLTITVKLPKNL